MLVFCCCYNELPGIYCFNGLQTYSHTVFEVRNSEISFTGQNQSLDMGCILSALQRIFTWLFLASRGFPHSLARGPFLRLQSQQWLVLQGKLEHIKNFRRLSKN